MLSLHGTGPSKDPRGSRCLRAACHPCPAGRPAPAAPTSLAQGQHLLIPLALLGKDRSPQLDAHVFQELLPAQKRLPLRRHQRVEGGVGDLPVLQPSAESPLRGRPRPCLPPTLRGEYTPLMVGIVTTNWDDTQKAGAQAATLAAQAQEGQGLALVCGVDQPCPRDAQHPLHPHHQRETQTAPGRI